MNNSKETTTKESIKLVEVEQMSTMDSIIMSLENDYKEFIDISKKFSWINDLHLLVANQNAPRNKQVDELINKINQQEDADVDFINIQILLGRIIEKEFILKCALCKANIKED